MRSTPQTVVTLLAVAFICTLGPFLMEWSGFMFLPMDLGGMGEHFAAYQLDGAMLRFDVVFVCAGLLGLALALALNPAVRNTRLSVALASTIAVSTVVDSLQIIDIPAHGLSESLLRQRVYEAAQLAHVLAGIVLIVGVALVRLRRRLGMPAMFGALVSCGVLVKLVDLVVLRGHAISPEQLVVSHLALLAGCVVCAGILAPELRRRPLPFYVVSVLAGALPLVFSQLSLLSMGGAVVVEAFNRATLLFWCGLFISLLGLSVDLARGAADHIRERERRYLRHVLDALPDLVHARDHLGRYRLLNRAAAAFLGGEPRDFEGKHVTECAHDPSAARRTLKHDRRILASGRAVSHPGMRATDSEGRRRWLQFHNEPLELGDGEPRQVLSVATDITRLKSAEHRLAERLEGERMLRSSLVRMLRSPITEFPEAMRDVLGQLGLTFGADSVFAYEMDMEAGVIRPQEHWQVAEENPRRREHDLGLFAWTLDRLRSGKEVIYHDPDELPDVPELVAYARSLGVRFGVFVPVFAKDGSLWGVLGGHFSEAPNDRGASLRRVLNHLADIYTAVRDHWLAEQELQDASRRAAESARAKGEFLANMSHEIRTPLNAVIGLADIVRELDPTEEQAQYLAMIQQAGGSLLGIINDVLDFSKIEAGQLALDPVTSDVPALLDEVVDMMAYHAQQQGLDLVYHRDPDARVRAGVDPVRLKQVLINLLNNAIKFTEEGHVSLRVCRQDRDGAPWCRFDVSDTGIGIPADKLDRVFGKFTQADASHTRKYGGTGLGLPICRTLAELMGGEVSVASKPGQGTRFAVEVPLSLAPDENRSPLPDPVLTGRRFVAVMPGGATRENLSTTLLELGLEGVTLGDPRELSAYLAGPVDLVIADGQMDPDALVSIRSLAREMEAAPHLVLLTPLGDARNQDALAAEGWHAALPKPVRRPALRRKLRSFYSPGLDDTASEERRESAIAADVRVLLAEDNPFNQKVATKLLEGLGCRTTVAENGRRAVDLAAEGEFDLVLMDCQMPMMDGLEATAHIRALDGEAARVPVVAMTANVLGKHRDACLAAGMDAFATKPINRQTLRAVLERWVGERSREPQLVG